MGVTGRSCCRGGGGRLAAERPIGRTYGRQPTAQTPSTAPARGEDCQACLPPAAHCSRQRCCGGFPLRALTVPRAVAVFHQVALHGDGGIVRAGVQRQLALVALHRRGGGMELERGLRGSLRRKPRNTPPLFRTCKVGSRGRQRALPMPGGRGSVRSATWAAAAAAAALRRVPSQIARSKTTAAATAASGLAWRTASGGRRIDAIWAALPPRHPPRRLLSSTTPLLRAEAIPVEETYQRKTPLEHVLLRPGMYIGSTELPAPATEWIFDEAKYV